MGANEDQLASIMAAGPYVMPNIGNLRNSLAALAETMKNVAGSPGWEGLSADAASDRLEQLSRDYYELEELIGGLEDQIVRANKARDEAIAAYQALAPAKAPDWVHGTLEAFDFPGIPQPVDLAQGGLAIIEGFLGDRREEAAAGILNDYANALSDPGTTMFTLARLVSERGTSVTGQEIPMPEPGPAGDSGGPGPGYAPPGGYTPPGYTPPGYPGPGSTGVPEYPTPEYPDPEYPTPVYPDPEIGVDDPGTGVLPDGPGGGPGGPSGPPGHPGGGGLPVGAGVGAGVAVAGAATAARLGGMAGAAGIGGAARLGTGGLLGGAGMGAPGMNGAGANAARAGGAAGSRGPGGGMMGAGANAGGRDEKERKRGRGLGGPMAPKLDDEDPTVLPGAGARAGGRDEAPASDDA